MEGVWVSIDGGASYQQWMTDSDFYVKKNVTSSFLNHHYSALSHSSQSYIITNTKGNDFDSGKNEVNFVAPN